jgi:Type III secretion system, cytoplasmic E component of needle
MARGFESKSVADQQESAADRATRRPAGAVDPVLASRRRRLELARADVERRLATVSVPAHRQMLERALRALDDEIAALG